MANINVTRGGQSTGDVVAGSTPGELDAVTSSEGITLIITDTGGSIKKLSGATFQAAIRNAILQSVVPQRTGAIQLQAIAGSDITNLDIDGGRLRTPNRGLYVALSEDDTNENPEWEVNSSSVSDDAIKGVIVSGDNVSPLLVQGSGNNAVTIGVAIVNATVFIGVYETAAATTVATASKNVNDDVYLVNSGANAGKFTFEEVSNSDKVGSITKTGGANNSKYTVSINTTPSSNSGGGGSGLPTTGKARGRYVIAKGTTLNEEWEDRLINWDGSSGNNNGFEKGDTVKVSHGGLQRFIIFESAILHSTAFTSLPPGSYREIDGGFRGDYANNKGYIVGDIVKYNNDFYIVETAIPTSNTTAPDTNTSFRSLTTTARIRGFAVPIPPVL